jgi:hypothetical protein
MPRDSAIVTGTDDSPAGRLTPLVAGLGAAVLYAATVAPDLTAGDSGELATAAAVWGLAHPPAYPLWTGLAHFWIRLLAPAGFTPVTATNLLSAALTALAIGLAAATLRRLAGNALAALAAALALAATGPVWAGAVVTEVYALLLLLVVALAATLLAAPAREAGPGRLCAAGALAGLAVTAHQLALLPLLVALPWFVRAARTPRRAAWVALGGVIGLLPLLLVPLRAAASPDLRWGWHDASDLWGYCGRAIYGRPAAAWQVWPVRVWRLAGVLVAGVGAAGLALAAAGWWTEARRRGGRRGAALASAALPTLALPALAALAPFTADADGASRVAPFLIVTAPALAAGWAFAFAAWGRLVRARGRVAAATGVLLFPLVLAWTQGPYHDHRRETAARLYAEDLLRGVPTGGTLLVDGDNEAFPLLYLRVVEGRRPDVVVRHRQGCVFAAGPDLYRLPPGEREAAARAGDAELVAQAAAGQTILCLAPGVEPPAETAARFATRGLLRRLIPAGTTGSGAEVPLAQHPDGAGARYLDYPTRRLLLPYGVAAWERAVTAGDGGAGAAALLALASLGHDAPDVRAWLAAGAVAGARRAAPSDARSRAAGRAR